MAKHIARENPELAFCGDVIIPDDGSPDGMDCTCVDCLEIEIKRLEDIQAHLRYHLENLH